MKVKVRKLDKDEALSYRNMMWTIFEHRILYGFPKGKNPIGILGGREASD
jgi:hypothetical protein